MCAVFQTVSGEGRVERTNFPLIEPVHQHISAELRETGLLILLEAYERKKTAFTSQVMKEISYLIEHGSTKLLVYLNKTNVTYHDNIPTDHQADVFGESPHKVHQSGTNVWRAGQNETLRPKRAFICERLVYRELKRSVC